MNDFQEGLARFRELVSQEAERNESPGLQSIRQLDLRAKRLQLRWLMAGSVMFAIVLIPVGVLSYEALLQGQRAAAQEKADTLLLQHVNDGLSRSVSRAMAPLVGRSPRN